MSCYLASITVVAGVGSRLKAPELLKVTREVLQAVSPDALLRTLDALKAKDEEVNSEVFNEDSFYKVRLDQVSHSAKFMHKGGGAIQAFQGVCERELGSNST